MKENQNEETSIENSSEKLLSDETEEREKKLHNKILNC